MKNLKKLLERRAQLRTDMQAALDHADGEQRALTEEEAAAFDAAENELKALDETIARIKRMRDVPEDEGMSGGEDGSILCRCDGYHLGCSLRVHLQFVANGRCH